MEGNQIETHTPEHAEGTTPPAATVPAPVDTNTPPAEVTPPAIDFKSADDTTKLKAYNDMFGTQFTSIEQIKPAPPKPTKEEIEAAAAQKRQEALSWAIAEGKLKQEDIEKAVLAKSKTTRDIAFELYAADLRNEDPDISEEDIKSSFEDYYHEDKDEKSPLRRAALKRMERLAESYRAENTSAYESVEGEYDKTLTSRAQYESYATNIKSVAKELPKAITIDVPYKSADGSTIEYKYEVPVDEKVMEKIRKDFLNENTFKFLGAEVKPEDVRDEMLTAIRGKMLPSIIAEVVRQDRENVTKEILARMKNIPSTGQEQFARTPPVGTPRQPIRHTSLLAASAGRRN